MPIGLINFVESQPDFKSSFDSQFAVVFIYFENFESALQMVASKFK
ncbi:MAG: hypothetical protein CM15mP102_09260 [Flavobacteriales bacterium]|nr:MAG: hypothetical protein CM15mP102_09260 [Flavobacteriales bacterium]